LPPTVSNLLLFSSGLRARYREDILRVLAQPEGTQMRFRYKLHHVSEDLLQPLCSDALRNARILLCFLDVKTDGRTPWAIPTRSGLLGHVRRVGEFCTLQLKLGQYLSANDVRSFNDVLATLL